MKGKDINNEYFTPFKGRHTSIIMLFYSFILTFSVLSCETYELDQWPINYPSEVQPQIDLFIDYAPAGMKAKPLKIILTGHIKSKGKKVVGLCKYSKGEIHLDTTSFAWKQARTNLVMHELGHFVLKRSHTYDTTTVLSEWKGFPTSLMHYTAGKPSDWNLNRTDLLDYYMTELFRLGFPTE